MKQKSQVLYNVLHQTRAGKIHTKTISLSTYTHVDSMQKDRAFFKLFHTYMNKQKNTNHPRFYVNDITSYDKPASYYSVTSTVPCNTKYKYTPMRICTQNPANGTSLLFFTYIIY